MMICKPIIMNNKLYQTVSILAASKFALSVKLLSWLPVKMAGSMGWLTILGMRRFYLRRSDLINFKHGDFAG